MTSSNSWRWSTLKEELLPLWRGKQLQQGWSPKCLPGPSPDNETWGVLKTTAIQPGWFDETQNKELPSSLAPRPAIEVEAGDLLMTCAGPRSRCGVPALVRCTRPRLLMSGKMYRFRPNESVDPGFLQYWLLSPEAQRRIDVMKTGISDSGLNLTQDRFLSLPVPVPSVSEQRRIVEIVEDHLSHLDAADEALAQSTRRVGAFQRCLLDKTFGLDAAETAVALGDLVASIRAGKSFGGSSGPAGADEWGVIKVSAMTWGEFDPSQNKAVPSERVDPRNEIRPGDLLVSRANTSEYVGASVLVGDVRPRLLLSDKSLRIEPKAGVERAWFWRALQAPSARRQISALATGTKDSMRNISQGALLSVKVPQVAAEHQVEAVRQFSEATYGMKPLETAIRQQRLRGVALRRAVLGAAFSGRLTGASSDNEIIEETADGDS